MARRRKRESKRAREERLARARRSRAAKKGWATRRARARVAPLAKGMQGRAPKPKTQIAKKAAEKGWATRRRREAFEAAKVEKAEAEAEAPYLTTPEAEEIARLEAIVKKGGPDAVEAMKRRTELAIHYDRRQAAMERERRAAAKRREEAALTKEPPLDHYAEEWSGPPEVDVETLMTEARRRMSAGREVHGVLRISLRRGGFAIVGQCRTADGRWLRLRGYEITQTGGERSFFWGRRAVVGRFSVQTAYDQRFVGSDPTDTVERPPGEHMVLAWRAREKKRHRKRKKERSRRP